MFILGSNGKLLKVINIEDLNYKEDVYDLTAVPNYNFFGILNREEYLITDKVIINDTIRYKNDIYLTAGPRPRILRPRRGSRTPKWLLPHTNG